MTMGRKFDLERRRFICPRQHLLVAMTYGYPNLALRLPYMFGSSRAGLEARGGLEHVVPDLAAEIWRKSVEEPRYETTSVVHLHVDHGQLD